MVCHNAKLALHSVNAESYCEVIICPFTEKLINMKSLTAASSMTVVLYTQLVYPWHYGMMLLVK
jgi:hypothetical protein